MQRITCFTAVTIIWYDILWHERASILTLKFTNWDCLSYQKLGNGDLSLYINKKLPLSFSALMQTFKTKRNLHHLKTFTIISRKETLICYKIQPSLPSNETMSYAIGQHTRKGRLKVISALSLDFSFYVSGITTVNTHLN